jgi:hypothetical protein
MLARIKIVANLVNLLFMLTEISSCSDPLTEKCRELSRKQIAFRKELGLDYTLIKTDAFYSSKLDACIHTEIAEVGVDAEIRDLSHSVMKDGGHFDVLLNCDAEGADSVRLDKLKEYRGQVYKVPFIEWLDDGFGGLPRTLKTPEVPYTKEQCRKVFDKWMSELKP